MARSHGHDQDEASHHPSWRAEAILAALAGGVFGLAIAAILALGLALGYAPMVALERIGVDLSMNALADSDEAAVAGHGGPGFVFVDIDRSACRVFARQGLPAEGGAPAGEGQTACETGSPAPMPLLLDFIRAAAASKAAVVILDVAAPVDTAEAARLRATLASVDRGPWIIVEAAARPDDDATSFGYFGDPQRDAAAWPPVGRVRPALMSPATDPAADDGVIRQYPPGGWIDVGAAPDRYVPSAPYLAALLADKRTARLADCAYYRDPAGCAPQAERARLWTSRRGRPLASPIHYRFKSLSLDPDSRATAEAELRYRGRYDRYEASDLLTNGRFVLAPNAVAGRIVILGSSLRSGMDWHATPLGPMSGSEVIINAAGSFAEFGVQTDEGPSDLRGRLARWSTIFGEKAQGVAYASLLMTPVWLMIHGLAHFVRPRARIGRIAVGLACGLIFVAGLAFVLRFELGHAAERLRAIAAKGHPAEPVDLLGPTLAVGLEGYAVFSSWLTRGVEGFFMTAWTAALARVRPSATRGDGE